MTSTAVGFRFLKFNLEFLLESKVLRRLYKNPSYPLTSSADGLYGHNPQSFLPKHTLKMQESQQLFIGGRLVTRE
jgi:hypothetical protein